MRSAFENLVIKQTRNSTSSKSGFTLVEIMIVVAIVGFMAAIAVPLFARARENAQKTTCIGNLKRISDAKQQWAVDNYKTSSAEPKPEDLYGPTLYLKAEPVCPINGTYKIKKVKDDPSCSLKKDFGHSLKPHPQD